jgi:hypothetical protein
MSELDTLRPTLDAIAVDEIREPDLPIVVALQEGNDLHTSIQKDDAWNRLLAVGAAPASLEGLPVAVAATRQAQSEWTVIRDRGKPQAQRDRETAGATLRADLVAACRWNLRDDATAQAVLDEIVQGEGVPDLVQDLLDLAMLIGRHETAFDGDETFDVATQAEAARSMAGEISAGLSEGKTPGDHQAAKLLRDRAFTHMDRLMTELREAGRYAFRKEPRRAAAFASEHLRKERRKARRRAASRTATPGAATGDGASTDA